MRKIIIGILILSFSLYILMTSITATKHYPDILITENVSTIEECIKIAKQALDIENKNIYINDVNVAFYNINKIKPYIINITFVEMNQYLFWKPYIYYKIELNLEKNIAYNISKYYCEYIVYDDIDISKWNKNIFNALYYEEVKDFINSHDINKNGIVDIITTNYEWRYRFIENDNNIVELSLNPAQ